MAVSIKKVSKGVLYKGVEINVDTLHYNSLFNNLFIKQNLQLHYT